MASFVRWSCVVALSILCLETHAFSTVKPFGSARVRSEKQGVAQLSVHTDDAVPADIDAHVSPLVMSQSFPGTASHGIWGALVEDLLAYRFVIMGGVLLAILGLAMSAQKAPAVFVVLGWAYASISMSLLNKEATTIFPFMALLVALQMGITDVTLVAAEGSKMKMGKWSDLAKWSVVPFFYSGVLISGLWALKVTTVSTVLILRNVLPLFTLVAERLCFSKSNEVTTPVILSMLIVVVGSVMYAHENISVSRHAIGFIMLNCVLVVLDRLVQRSLLASPDFSVSPAFCMLFNNTVGILLIALLALCNEEVWQWPQALAMADQNAWFWICLTGVNGCCLGYLGIRTQKLVSATSFLMLQNANKVLLILLSVAIFGDSMSGLPLAGCMLSMGGSLWYGALCLPKETAVPKEES